MYELEINESKCEVNKRRLVLDFTCHGKEYRFEHDHWNHWEDDKTSPPMVARLYINDEEVLPVPAIVVDNEELIPQQPPFTQIMWLKHNLQVAIHDVGPENDMLFIDRRYDHNHSFDVYFHGKAYSVGHDWDKPLKGESNVNE